MSSDARERVSSCYCHSGSGDLSVKVKDDKNSEDNKVRTNITCRDVRAFIDPSKRCITCCQLKDDVIIIQRSLEALSKQLTLQQTAIVRDIEERTLHVYDDVVKDMNAVRQSINTLGNTFASKSKYKSWKPLTPFCKQIFTTGDKKRSSVKLSGSRSVDCVNADENKSASSKPRYVPIAIRFQQNRNEKTRSLNLSDQRFDSCTGPSQFKGFETSLNKDGKPVQYQSQWQKYMAQTRPYLGWGLSRYTSKETEGDIVDGDAKLNKTEAEAVSERLQMNNKSDVITREVTCQGELDIAMLQERLADMARLRLEVVDVHNEIRRLYGVQKLTLFPDLAKHAQTWAETLAKKGFTQYSNLSDRGENITTVDLTDGLTGWQIVQPWFQQRKLYNYSQPRWQKDTWNFTQMIWKSSTTIGVGIAKFPHSDKYVVVVQYQPTGNINTLDQFRRNVQRPIVCVDSYIKRSALGAISSCKVQSDTVPHKSLDEKPADKVTDEVSKCKTEIETTENKHIQTIIGKRDENLVANPKSDIIKGRLIVYGWGKTAVIDVGLKEQITPDSEESFIPLEQTREKSNEQKLENTNDANVKNVLPIEREEVISKRKDRDDIISGRLIACGWGTNNISDNKAGTNELSVKASQEKFKETEENPVKIVKNKSSCLRSTPKSNKANKISEDAEIVDDEMVKSTRVTSEKVSRQKKKRQELGNQHQATIKINEESKMVNSLHGLTDDTSMNDFVPGLRISCVSDHSLEELLDLLGEDYTHHYHQKQYEYHNPQISNKNVTFSKTVTVKPVFEHETVLDNTSNSSEKEDGGIEGNVS